MSGRPLATLHVAQPTVAGVAEVVAHLAGDQARQGWTVTVASPSGGDLHDRLAGSGAGHVEWRAERSPGPTTFGEARALGRIVRRTRPDIIHLHSSKAGLAGRLAIRGRHPTVFQPHAWSFLAAGGILAPATTAWERFATRWTDAIICVSADERRAGSDAGIRCRWHVVPNGVDPDAWSFTSREEAAAAREGLGLAGGPVAACIGRLCPQKGQRDLVAAWAEVSRLVPTARLALVGSGPDASELAAMSGDTVILPGWRTDVARWIAAADVIVIPSRWEAGLSLAAMEAMARGRSVIATDVAGMRENIDGAGEVVPIGDIPALAAALARRLGDPQLARAEGVEGRRTIERRFDRSATASRVIAVYRDVLTRIEDAPTPRPGRDR
jgi:glycosyltransferase involved in cell wall biosynthesis